MTIKQITLFVCEFCEDAYQADGVGAEAIRDAQSGGWINDSGHHFCGEECFDTYFARNQEKDLK